MYESGCWRQSLREILIIRFEINGIMEVGVGFKSKLPFFH